MRTTPAPLVDLKNSTEGLAYCAAFLNRLLDVACANQHLVDQAWDKLGSFDQSFVCEISRVIAHIAGTSETEEPITFRVARSHGWKGRDHGSSGTERIRGASGGNAGPAV